MTAMVQSQSVSTTRGPFRSPRARGRAITAVILILSLIFSGIMRQVVADRRESLINVRGQVTSRSTLGNMDSFALALLLGGLRGPLVMILWPAIESQKTDRNLQDVDTMIEWVRLLQPEFDTVHMFQIWNKAYNVSVLMASPANKYAVILQALDYAQSVDRERPGDINILNAISNVYGGKLGSPNLAEFPFYNRQFHEESMTEARRKEAYPDDPNFVRITKWKPFLDDQNQIRADLLNPTGPRPVDLPVSSEWNDGSELQYLKRYAPFPRGISPLAMSYNYGKRAQVAQSVEGQKSLQVSAMVIDSQPGLQIKFWEEDDARHGRDEEAMAFGVPRGGSKLEVATGLDHISLHSFALDRTAFEGAEYFYSMASRLAADGIVEYERHLSNPEYSMRRAIYASHIAELQCAQSMYAGDYHYLQATQITDAIERSKLLITVKGEYETARARLERTALAHFTEDAALFAKGQTPDQSVLPPLKPGERDLGHQRVYSLDDAQVDQAFTRAMIVAAKMNEHADDRLAFTMSVTRCRARISLIEAELGSSLK